MDIKILYLTHFLSALLLSLDSFNTYTAAHYRDKLASVSTISELVVDKVRARSPHQALDATR